MLWKWYNIEIPFPLNSDFFFLLFLLSKVIFTLDELGSHVHGKFLPKFLYVSECQQLYLGEYGGGGILKLGS